MKGGEGDASGTDGISVGGIDWGLGFKVQSRCSIDRYRTCKTDKDVVASESVIV